MAKEDSVKRDLISYEGELRKWLEVRLNPDYRIFFDGFSSKFLNLVYKSSEKK